METKNITHATIESLQNAVVYQVRRRLERGQMKLVIYGRLPSLNEYTLANRRNRFAGAKVKKDAEKIITHYIQEQLTERIEGTAYLEFHWYEANKKRDLDNICSAKKFILDALVENQILVTDSWRGVRGFRDYFEVDKDNPRIEVIISEYKD